MLCSLLSALWGPRVAAQSHAAQAVSDRNETTAEAAKHDDDAKRRQEESHRGLRGWINRRITKFTSPSEVNGNGLSLSAGIIVAGSSLAGGVGYRHSDVLKGGIDVELNATVSVRRYQEYSAAIGLLNARASTLEFGSADTKVPSLFNASARKARGSALYLEMRYLDYPQHTYYGTGIDSREGDRADYALSGTSVEGVWQRQITPVLGFSARGGVLDLEVDPGHNDALVNVEDRFVPASIAGAREQPRFITLGGGLVHDARSDTRVPQSGRMVGISFRRFAATDMPDLSFTRVTLDARGYQPTFSRGVLAARALVSNDFTRDNGSTPFYLQQSLGGGETLRGFHSYRFPDQTLAHGTVEYRLRAHRFVEVAPFFDFGTVADGLSRLSLGSVKATPGIGIRARTEHRYLGRLDLAHSPEGFRLAFGSGHVF